jgi:hypothetical protein
MVLFRMSGEVFLKMGLNLIGFDLKRQRSAPKNSRRFREARGVGPSSLAAAFVDIQETGVPNARIDVPDPPVYFLITVNWLQSYKLESEMAGFFKIDKETARKHVWKCSTANFKLK